MGLLYYNSHLNNQTFSVKITRQKKIETLNGIKVEVYISLAKKDSLNKNVKKYYDANSCNN